MRASLQAVAAILLTASVAIRPGEAQAGSLASTYSSSSTFGGSFVRRGYDARYNGVGPEDGYFGTTFAAACLPNSDCAYSSGGTQSTDPNLYASASASSIMDTDNRDGVLPHQAAASSTARASLYTGELGAIASGQSRSCPGYECGPTSSARAQIVESVHFAVQGAGAQTHTPLGISFTIDGIETPDAFARVLLQVAEAGQSMGTFLTEFRNNGIVYTPPATGFTSYSILPDGNSVHFFGYYDLIGAAPDFSIAYGLAVDSGHGLSDFSHTAKFNFALPVNVSFTSDSGVFLRDANVNANAVPEPASWAMMLLGFGAIGTARRRSFRPVRLSQ